VVRLLLLLLLPGLAFADEAIELGPLAVPLPGSELTLTSKGDLHWEGKDSKTGWTWRVESVGDGRMQIYPEPKQVVATVVRRDQLLEATDVAVLPMAGSLGAVFGARTKAESVRTCFVGRAGSLWLVTMRSSRSMIEASEAALRQACRDSSFAGLTEASSTSLVGLSFDRRVPVDWQVMTPPGPRSRSAAFNQSATGLTGIVTQQPREGHPYDTGDVAELQRELGRQGFRVRVSEVMRAAGQDAPRLEVARPSKGGAEEDWLMVVVRSKNWLWTVQSPARNLGYPMIKRMYDMALTEATLVED
jgi:hypothetical protein